jgi:hypothetical protein
MGICKRIVSLRHCLLYTYEKVIHSLVDILSNANAEDERFGFETFYVVINIYIMFCEYRLSGDRGGLWLKVSLLHK